MEKEVSLEEVACPFCHIVLAGRKTRVVDWGGEVAHEACVLNRHIHARRFVQGFCGGARFEQNLQKVPAPRLSRVLGNILLEKRRYAANEKEMSIVGNVTRRVNYLLGEDVIEVAQSAEIRRMSATPTFG